MQRSILFFVALWCSRCCSCCSSWYVDRSIAELSVVCRLRWLRVTSAALLPAGSGTGVHLVRSTWYTGIWYMLEYTSTCIFQQLLHPASSFTLPCCVWITSLQYFKAVFQAVIKCARTSIFYQYQYIRTEPTALASGTATYQYTGVSQSRDVSRSVPSFRKCCALFL